MLAGRDAWEAAITDYIARGGPFRMGVPPFIEVEGRGVSGAHRVESLGRNDRAALHRQLAEHKTAWEAEHRRMGIAAIREDWDRQGERSAESALAFL
ncbi:MAG: hypothetical protein AAFX62_06900 [Pseudomonadota bacterium]